ncbi:MAG: hypothetical protein O3C28_18385 [Proteobacteria bacterium]|nr:hypothetical protein [Pseudomonadota bacterium]
MKTMSCAVIYFCLMLTGCGGPGSQADKFVGHWESHSFTMDISWEDDAYHVEIDNPRGMLGGSYAGELAPLGLIVTLPLAGEQFILLTGDSDQLEFLGEQLEKQVP